MDLTATSGVLGTYTAEAATVNSQAAAKPDTTILHLQRRKRILL